MFYLVVLTFLFVLFVLACIVTGPPLRDIPVVGWSGSITSYFSSIRFFFHAQPVVDGAMQRLGPFSKLFQLRVMGKWRVVVFGREAIDEVFAAPSLTHIPFSSEMFQFKYTIHPEIGRNPDIHRPFIRYITSKLGDFFPDITDEVQSAIDAEYTTGKGPFKGLEGFMRIACRVSNRIFVGKRLGSNPAFCKEMLASVQGILMRGMILNSTPELLKPTMHKILSFLFPTCSTTQKMILDELQHLLSATNVQTSEHDEHNIDLLSWISQGGQPGKDHKMIALYIILFNLAGTHTTTMTLTQTVYDLVSRPEHLESIRSEIEDAFSEKGLSMEMIASLPKLDSFMKESWRLSNIGAFPLSRLAVKKFTFLDGTEIPAGTILSIPTTQFHRDSNIYERPADFDSFRFFEQVQKNGLADIEPNWFFFGHGKHSCPGRFLAILSIKTVIVHLLLNYDISLDGQPKSQQFAWFAFPDPKANILLRKRHTE